MRWLVSKLPPGGLILDPFAGSGSTLLAADAEGFDSVAIERDPGYFKIASERIASAENAAPLFTGSGAGKVKAVAP